METDGLLCVKEAEADGVDEGGEEVTDGHYAGCTCRGARLVEFAEEVGCGTFEVASLAEGSGGIADRVGRNLWSGKSREGRMGSH